MSLNGSDQDPWGKPKQNGQPPENNSSDNNEGQSNWDRSSNSQKNNQQSPPDLEEVFNNLLKKLGGKGSRNNSSSSNQLPGGLGKLLPIAIAAVSIPSKKPSAVWYYAWDNSIRLNNPV